MGLFSRIGKEWANEAKQPAGSTLGQYIGGPLMMGGIGAGLGGGAGAAFGSEGGTKGALDGATFGGGIMGAGLGAVGGAASGSMALRQLVVSIARAIKQRAPDMPDEMAMQQAMKILQTKRGPQNVGMFKDEVLNGNPGHGMGRGPNGY